MPVRTDPILGLARLKTRIDAPDLGDSEARCLASSQIARLLSTLTREAEGPRPLKLPKRSHLRNCQAIVTEWANRIPDKAAAG